MFMMLFLLFYFLFLFRKPTETGQEGGKFYYAAK